MTLAKGDTFKIKTKIGYGFLQYIETDDLGIEYIRIIDCISEEGSITQEDVNKLERWSTGFPLKAAVRKKNVERVGIFEVPSCFENYEYARSKHFIRGEFIGWHIINRKTLKRELKKTLTQADLKLSPHGIMNDTLIAERLEEDWKLDNWK